MYFLDLALASFLIMDPVTAFVATTIFSVFVFWAVVGFFKLTEIVGELTLKLLAIIALVLGLSACNATSGAYIADPSTDPSTVTIPGQYPTNTPMEEVYTNSKLFASIGYSVFFISLGELPDVCPEPHQVGFTYSHGSIIEDDGEPNWINLGITTIDGTYDSRDGSDFDLYKTVDDRAFGQFEIAGKYCAYLSN